MHIETERLYIRSFTDEDADALYTLKYIPGFLERDITKERVYDYVRQFQEIEAAGDTRQWRIYAIVNKQTGDVMGTLSFSENELLHEYELGWEMMGQYAGKGYASEAAAAFAEYFCETYGVDYLIAVMDVDNPASFRTAEKSGFRLFEKRTVFAYNRYCDDYYYFRRYYSKSALEHKFYDDQVYTGRGAEESDK